MRPSDFTRARALVGRLTHSGLARDDPKLLDARLRMDQAFVIEKITQVIDQGPDLTPDLRARIDAVLAEREVFRA